MQTTKTGTELELPEDLDARKIAIKERYPVEVLCPRCHGIVFFYRSSPVRGREFQSHEALTIDGTQPLRLHPQLECRHCHETVSGFDLTWRGKSW